MSLQVRQIQRHRSIAGRISGGRSQLQGPDPAATTPLGVSGFAGATIGPAQTRGPRMRQRWPDDLQIVQA